MPIGVPRAATLDIGDGGQPPTAACGEDGLVKVPGVDRSREAEGVAPPLVVPASGILAGDVDSHGLGGLARLDDTER
jgi:hypothetical protein